MSEKTETKTTMQLSTLNIEPISHDASLNALCAAQSSALQSAKRASQTKPITELILLFDRSGSMQDYQIAAVEGYNYFIEEQKKQGMARFTLIWFDRDQEMEYASKSIGEVDRLHGIHWGPGKDGTALNDAIGRSIVAMRDKLVKQNRLDTQKVVFAVLTDEAGSGDHFYTEQDVRGLIKIMTDKHGWEFIFLPLESHYGYEDRYGIPAKNIISCYKIGARAGIEAFTARITDARGTNDG